MTETVLQKLSIAERWLAEAKDLSELKEIHDIAVAAESYAQAHRLGIDAENHAREIKMVAGYRIAELQPPMPPKEKSSKGGKMGGRGRNNKISKKKEKVISDKETTYLPPKKMAEFRKLKKAITEPELRKRCKKLAEKQEKISVNKLLRGDFYQMSETPEWETPQWLFDVLNDEFHFDIDVCASEQNHKCVEYYSKENDGLSQPWHGVCWMNPPYGRIIKDWMQKAKQASENGCIVVCLVPARPDTEWWWDNCIQGEIRFIRGRLQWPGSDTMAPFPSAVVILSMPRKQKVVWWNVQDR